MAALSASGQREVYQVTEAIDSSRRNFSLNAKTTRLRLAGPKPLGQLRRPDSRHPRPRPERSAPARRSPDTSCVQGTSITIDKTAIAPLPSGRTLLVTGTSCNSGIPTAEIVTLDSTASDPDGNVILYLQSALVNSYIRASVRSTPTSPKPPTARRRPKSSAAATAASPTRASPSARIPSPIPRPPPHRAAPAPSKSASRPPLDRASQLYTAGPSDRVYTSSIADDGTVSVDFGDGVAGSRLPTGTANVSATYRVGTRPRRHGRRQPDQHAARPSARPQERHQSARPHWRRRPRRPRRSPRQRPAHCPHARPHCLAGRLPELRARLLGIAKARADWFWEGEQTPVFVTVAPSSGAPAPTGSDPYGNLRAAIDAARDPAAIVRVASYTPVSFGVGAAVLVDKPTYVAADVLAAVTSAVTNAFSFANRDFAQPVFSSEISAVIQAVPGVIASQITQLWASGRGWGFLRIPARPSPPLRPTPNASSTAPTSSAPAELLTLDPTLLSITEMTQL